MEGSCQGTSAQPRSSATMRTIFGWDEEKTAGSRAEVRMASRRTMSRGRLREKSWNKFGRQVKMVAVIPGW